MKIIKSAILKLNMKLKKEKNMKFYWKIMKLKK